MHDEMRLEKWSGVESRGKEDKGVEKLRGNEK
jgi:hypothetical protein